MAALGTWRLARSDSGAAAVEFGLVAPVFAALIMGIIFGSLMVYTVSSLHFAVEGAARCASVMTNQCTDATTTQQYAHGLYKGPSVPQPVFTATTAACGHQVTGSLTYVLNIVLAQWSVPLSATACFP
jgi:Flp pilus assembly protein TadG